MNQQQEDRAQLLAALLLLCSLFEQFALDHLDCEETEAWSSLATSGPPVPPILEGLPVLHLSLDLGPELQRSFMKLRNTCDSRSERLLQLGGFMGPLQSAHSTACLR